MKLIRHLWSFGIEYKVLLRAGIVLPSEFLSYRRVWLAFYDAFATRNRTVMDYNQLKLKILRLFKGSEQYESAQVLALVSNNPDTNHTDKAIEMALLRYWRQGLLKRTRRQGRFYYEMTERGVARREWLLKTTQPSEA